METFGIGKQQLKCQPMLPETLCQPFSVNGSFFEQIEVNGTPVPDMEGYCRATDKVVFSTHTLHER